MPRQFWYLTLIFLVVANYNSIAEKQGDWFEAVIILKNKSILVGKTKINPTFNAVQFDTGKSITCIHARDIDKINFHDDVLKTLRCIVSVTSQQYDNPGDSFYEVVVSGEISLLVRQDKYVKLWGVNKKNHHNYISYDNFISKTDLFFYDGKTLIPMVKFRKYVYPAFQKYYGIELAQLIRHERLNLNDPYDQLTIMKHFNSLYSGNSLLVQK